MTRKRLTRLVACVLLLCLLPATLAFPVSAKQYNDLYPGMLPREFFDAFNFVIDNGYMQGTSNTMFSPYLSMTRGMFVTVLYRYANSSEKTAPSFSDVPSNQYYYYPVGWASNHGLVRGTTTTTFEPDASITREQMAVILYRYAKSIEKKTFTVSSFSSISGHPDYSSVSSYAREAVRWAKTYHIIPLTNNSQYINPTSDINRAYVSLGIANYAKNVTGFEQKDRFSFINSPLNFHNKNIITSQALRRLDNCINSYYGGANANAIEERENIRSIYVGQDRAGTCFGYTMSLFLDKLGKIDFNKNCASSAATMNNVGIPKNNTATVESAINYYQALHSLSCFQDQRDVYSGNSLYRAPASLYQQFSNYGAVPFSFFWETTETDSTTGEEKEAIAGHALLLVDISRRSDGNYDLSYIDPNKLNNYSPIVETLYISNNTISFYGKNIVRFYLYPTTTIHWFDNFDIDGDYNTIFYEPVSLSRAAENDASVSTDSSNGTANIDSPRSPRVIITIPAVRFQLTNAAGEVLSFNGHSFSGTMEIISESMVPEDPDTPCTLILELPESESFEFSNLSGDYMSFSISSSYGAFCVSGTGIHSVLFDTIKKSLSVEGTAIDYSLYQRTDIQQFEYFYLNGSNPCSFSVEIDGCNVITSNLTGTATVGYAPANSLEPEFIPITFNSLSSIDFSEAANTDGVHVTTDAGDLTDMFIPFASTVRGDLHE